MYTVNRHPRRRHPSEPPLTSRYLSETGHEVTVASRTASRAEKLIEVTDRSLRVSCAAPNPSLHRRPLRLEILTPLNGG